VSPKERAILSFWVKDSFREDTTGYFLKEALVDDVVVWQEDIAGDQGWEHICVDVTERVAGKDSVRLAFRTTCLQDIRFPPTYRCYSYTGLVEAFIFLDDVMLFGFEIQNGDLESSGSWTFSRGGSGTPLRGSFYASDARSGCKSYLLADYYLGEPNAGDWAKIEQTVTNSAPGITAHSPDWSPVLADAEVSATFSEPMNKPAAESAFSISPSMPGHFTWIGNRMIFRPEGYLQYDQHYVVSVSTTATDLAGRTLTAGLAWQFSTHSEPPEQNVVAHPNPYTEGYESGCVQFSDLARECTINIYDVSGRRVGTLHHRDTSDGGSENWDVSDVSSGVYLYVVRSSAGMKKGKLSVIK